MNFMPDEKIIAAIKQAREGKKRNFSQSFDLIINLKNIDLKKPENKIKTDVFLPKARGKDIKIGIIADMLIPSVKSIEDKNTVLIRKDELEGLGKNKKTSKALARSCKAFIAEAPLMPLVGRYLGQALGPLNKMPTPIPPNLANLKPILEKTKSAVKLVLKDSPVIQCMVGSESTKDEDIAENIEAVLKAMESSLPKGKEQIKNAFVKTTMGKAVKCLGV